MQWRENPADLRKYAAAMKGTDVSRTLASPSRAGAAGSSGAKPVKLNLTPHVALAARLLNRHPGLDFVLGERIPYVFVVKDGVTLQVSPH